MRARRPRSQVRTWSRVYDWRPPSRPHPRQEHAEDPHRRCRRRLRWPRGRAVGRPTRRAGRRVAELRRRRGIDEVLAARPDRRRQLRRAQERLALAFGRRISRQDGGRRRVVRQPRSDLRPVAQRGSAALARRPAALHPQPEGDASDAGRSAAAEHADRDRRRRSPGDRRDGLGVQPEELREGHHHDDRGLEPARRRPTGPTARRATRPTAASTGARGTAT